MCTTIIDDLVPHILKLCDWIPNSTVKTADLDEREEDTSELTHNNIPRNNPKRDTPEAQAITNTHVVASSLATVKRS